MKNYLLSLISLVLFCYKPVEAQILQKNTSGFYPEVFVNFPLFIGAGGGYSFNENFQADLLYAVTPQPFYTVIGQFAAESGGNAAYQDVIEAAFQNNSIVRLSATYNLDKKTSGWHFSLAGSILTASGNADIDKVLGAANGRDYSLLKTLLTTSGRDTRVQMNSNLQIFEALISYSWAVQSNWVFDISGGFAKVVASDVSLKSGLTAFESTQAGNNLMRSSESDIETIINDYGLSPTLGIQIKYLF